MLRGSLPDSAQLLIERFGKPAPSVVGNPRALRFDCRRYARLNFSLNACGNVCDERRVMPLHCFPPVAIVHSIFMVRQTYGAVEAKGAYMAQESLSGKIAVITGGARGIGYAVAQRLLEEGAKVAFCALRQNSVDSAEAS